MKCSANETLRTALRDYFRPATLAGWCLFFSGLVLVVYGLAFWIFQTNPGDEPGDYQFLSRLIKSNLAGFSGLFGARLAFTVFRIYYRDSIPLAAAASLVWLALIAGTGIGVGVHLAVQVIWPTLALVGASSGLAIAGATMLTGGLLGVPVLRFWFAGLASDLKAPVSSKPAPQFLEFRSEGRGIQLPVADLVYLEARGKRALVHTADHSHLVAETLKALLGRLPADEFVRIHKSFVVNLNCVREVSRNHNGGTLALKDADDSRLPIARTALVALDQALNQARR